MPRPRSIPTYRRHKQSGQAVVTLTDPSGRRRDVLLGKYNTTSSRQEYARVLAEWEAAGQLLPDAVEGAAKTDLTLNELILAYWHFAEEYYGFTPERGDAACLRGVLAVVRQLYGNARARVWPRMSDNRVENRPIGARIQTRSGTPEGA